MTAQNNQQDDYLTPKTLEHLAQLEASVEELGRQTRQIPAAVDAIKARIDQSVSPPAEPWAATKAAVFVLIITAIFGLAIVGALALMGVYP